MADNMVTLVGSLGTEPELRTTPQGADVVNFTLATSDRMRNAEGKWVDGPTSWFRITVWSTLARNAHASLHKGQRVVVHGPLRIAEFTTGSGGTSKSAEVKALALGPDLAFGTSTFTKGGQPQAETQPPAVAETQPGWPVTPKEAEPAQQSWATPMAEVETPF